MTEDAAQSERLATSLSDRIRQWDDWVEDEDEGQEEARRPFDAGIMLAVAKVLERWESGDDLAEAMRDLTDTVEAVLDGSGAFPDEEEEAPSEESGPSEEVQR